MTTEKCHFLEMQLNSIYCTTAVIAIVPRGSGKGGGKLWHKCPANDDTTVHDQELMLRIEIAQTKHTHTHTTQQLTVRIQLM